MLILFSNEEVDNISQIMESNTNYVVLPIQGCTTTLFITIFKKFPHIDIIHIAGQFKKKCYAKICGLKYEV